MSTKRILLVSNYYPPERGAAPNRIQVMAHALHQKGYRVEVVCPMPNYPTGSVFSEFKGKVYHKSESNGIHVHRLWLWPSKSTNKFIRLLSMVSFAMSLKWFFLLKRIPKLVFIQYSPVFVGFTAVLWSKILGKKIILNISDLWPLAGLEMGLLNKGVYYSVLERLERFCYKNSDLILGQSEEILTHVAQFKVPAAKLLYRNIPNFEATAAGIPLKAPPIKIVYAGLLGMAQGLSKLFENITIPPHVEFHIYGEGPDAAQLVQPKNMQIVYHGSVTRESLHNELKNYSIAVIPLVTRIYGSVPSKIFEYSRLGLPLLYMAGGEGAKLVREHNLGWVIPVGEYAKLQAFLDRLSPKVLEEFLKHHVQQSAVQHFNFERQFEVLLDKINSL